VLRENGNAVTLWDINTARWRIPARAQRTVPARRAFADGWKVETDFAKAIGGRECLVLAIPSQSFRTVAAR